jgi:hypothetical protein
MKDCFQCKRKDAGDDRDEKADQAALELHIFDLRDSGHAVRLVKTGPGLAFRPAGLAHSDYAA